MHQRILLLGPTGVDKRKVFSRLAAKLQEKFGLQASYVDFENEVLKDRLPGAKSWTNFLWQYPADQHRVWLEAWKSFKPKTGEVVVLGLHGAFTSEIVGLRCPIDIPAVCNDFAPTLVVTLIDDVYAAWSQTEQRAGGRHDKGRPTFEQHLIVRRAEQFVGDLIVTHSKSPKVRHVLCSIRNPTISLANLIGSDADVTYLSFPISEPRRMAKNGDTSLIELINKGHALALSEMESDASRAFISPLSIDELPLADRLKAAKEDRVVFEPLLDRWKMEGAWGDDDAMLADSFHSPVDAPKAQLEDAIGIIETDVGWRDRRLVMQAKSLAIICPKPPGRESITGGVRDEVGLAITHGIFCHWWQPAEWDPTKVVNSLWPAAGSMGIGQSQTWTMQSQSLEQLIQSKP